MLNKNLFLGAMISAGYTQQTLADAINMSKNTMSSRVNGKSYFDTKEISKLCYVLKISSNAEKVNIFLCKPSQNKDDPAA